MVRRGCSRLTFALAGKARGAVGHLALTLRGADSLAKVSLARLAELFEVPDVSVQRFR